MSRWSRACVRPWPMAGSPSACTSTTLLAEDKGGVLPTPLYSVGAGADAWQPWGGTQWGLTAEGVVPSDPVSPPQVAGRTPLSRRLQACGDDSFKRDGPTTNADGSYSISASDSRVPTE